MTKHDSTARHAVSFLKRGIATLSEVAELAGVSRQLVRYWADREGLDWRAARSERLRRMWERSTRR